MAGHPQVAIARQTVAFARHLLKDIECTRNPNRGPGGKWSAIGVANGVASGGICWNGVGI